MAAGQVDPGEQPGRVPGRRHQIARSSSKPVSASAAIARPFHAATTLSSGPGGPAGPVR